MPNTEYKWLFVNSIIDYILCITYCVTFCMTSSFSSHIFKQQIYQPINKGQWKIRKKSIISMTFISLYVQNLTNLIVFIQKCPNFKVFRIFGMLFKTLYSQCFYTIYRTMKMIKWSKHKCLILLQGDKSNRDYVSLC